MVCVLWLRVLQSAVEDEPQWKPKIVVEHCGPDGWGCSAVFRRDRLFGREIAQGRKVEW